MKDKVYKFSGIFLERELFLSKAFFQLLKESGKSLQVFLIFMRKRQLGRNPNKRAKPKYLVTNNGKIIFPYREAKEKYGYSYSVFSKAIDKLVELGFIDIAQNGVGWARIPTLYKISDRWENYGSESFKVKKRVKSYNHKFEKGHPKYDKKQK